jgi:hypothetical protein
VAHLNNGGNNDNNSDSDDDPTITIKIGAGVGSSLGGGGMLFCIFKMIQKMRGRASIFDIF